MERAVWRMLKLERESEFSRSASTDWATQPAGLAGEEGFEPPLVTALYYD